MLLNSVHQFLKLRLERLFVQINVLQLDQEFLDLNVS